MKRSLRLLVAMATAIGLSIGLSTSPVAAAPNGTANWKNNENTGFCNLVDGGYVVAAQAVLMNWGSYTGQIDNWWGSGSNSALRSFQQTRGLQVDGCAGPSTWSNMQKLTDHWIQMYVCTDPSLPGGLTGDIYIMQRGGRTSYFMRPGTFAANRYWHTDTQNKAASPVQNGEYYRFGNNLHIWC